MASVIGLLLAYVKSKVGTAFNPSDKSANLSLSNGNLTVTYPSGSGDQGVRSVGSHKSGKYYFEVTAVTNCGTDGGIGIADSTATLTTIGSTVGHAAMVFFNTGNIWVNTVSSGLTIGSFAANEVVCVAVDLDNERIWFRKNAGNWNGSAANDPATNTGGRDLSGFLTTGVTSVFAAACSNSTTCNMTVNFGDSGFAQAVPSGFTAGFPP